MLSKRNFTSEAKKAASAPADTQSNLEHFLRNHSGIHIIARKQMLMAYFEDNGTVLMQEIFDEAARSNMIDTFIKDRLQALIIDENA